jgi:hypothetical protein
MQRMLQIWDDDKEKEEANVEFGTVVFLAGVFVKGRNPNDGCMGFDMIHDRMTIIITCRLGFQYSTCGTGFHFSLIPPLHF